MDAPIEWVVNKLWVLLIGWFWYEKRNKDARLTKLEEKTASQETSIQLLETKLDGLKELIEVKFDNLNVNLTELKQITKHGERRNED